MKRTATFSNIVGLLLLLSLGCQRLIEPVKPLIWAEQCRVTRTVYKTIINQGLLREPERITIGGKTFVVGINVETRYYYDGQGRLVREVFNDPADSLYHIYRYTPTHLYSYTTSMLLNGKPRRDTVRLDGRGLAERDLYDRFHFQYDENGYPIKSLWWNEAYKGTMTIKEGNMISRDIAYGPGHGTRTWSMTYDTTRSNIPTIKRYLGRESKNLPIEEVSNIKQSTYYPNGDVYKRTFTYEFNQKGQVKRRIAYGTQLKPGWLFSIDPQHLGIIDYEYECL